MAASAKTLSPLGLAFAAGFIALTAANAVAAPSTDRGQTSSSPEEAKDGGTRAWTDPPAHHAPAPAAAAPKPTPTTETAQSPEAAPAARDMDTAQASSTRRERTNRAGAVSSGKKAARVASKQTAPARRQASSASRKAGSGRLAFAHPERRQGRAYIESGYRTAAYPIREGYAVVEATPSYGYGYAPYPGHRVWDGEAETRVYLRSRGGSDGLVRWLAQPRQGY